jgi:hypothetical protein
VRERDWFDAPGRPGLEEWIARCAELLEAFYVEVHTRTSGAGVSPDEHEVAHQVQPVVAVRTTTARTTSARRRPAPRRKEGPA